MLYTEIYKYLDQYISGNEEPKQQLSTLGYLYTQRCIAAEAGILLSSLPRMNAFVTGPTGSGKTFMLEKLAECLSCPFIRIDCSSISQVGWEGVSVDEQLAKYSKKLMPDRPFGIIMLDEFDKLGNLVRSSKGSTPNLGIQYNLLDLLDGKYQHPYINVDLNQSLVVCAGAFSETTKAAKKGTKSIGFTNELNTVEEINYKKLFADSGIIDEIIGRIVTIIKTEPLNKAEIKELLHKKDGTACRKYSTMLRGLSLAHYEVDDLVDKLYTNEYGVRALDAEMYEIVSNNIMKKFKEKVK